MCPFVLEGLDLGADLVARSSVRRTTSRFERRNAQYSAVVRAVVADVQRGEQHDPVAVDVALQLPGGVEDLARPAPGRRPPAARPSPPPPAAPWPCSWRSRRAARPGSAGRSSKPCESRLVDEIAAAGAQLRLSIVEGMVCSVRRGRRHACSDSVDACSTASGDVVRRIAAAAARRAAERSMRAVDAVAAQSSAVSRDARLVRINLVVDAVLRRRQVGHDHVRPAHQPQLAAAGGGSAWPAPSWLGMFARGHTSRARAITL